MWWSGAAEGLPLLMRIVSLGALFLVGVLCVVVVLRAFVHKAELLEDLSLQTDVCYISEVPHRSAEKVRA